MKIINRLLISFIFLTVFCSCQSTRVYIKEHEEFYQDDVLVEDKASVTKYDYKDSDCQKFQKKTVQSEEITHTYNVADLYKVVSSEKDSDVVHMFWVDSKRTEKSKTEKFNFKLVEANLKNNKLSDFNIIGKREATLKNGKISGKKGSKFKKDDEALYKDVVANLEEQVKKLSDEDDVSENTSQNITRKNYSERIQINSTPNGSYIFYTIAGKPFVIAGAATWNVLRCAGYSVINFLGGYAAVTSSGDAVFWKLPSYSKSKDKAYEAKEANKIKYYPEYHLPFTNNHIIVDKYEKNINVENLTAEGREQIEVAEHMEYDNTMSVKRSSKADAASTAATGGLIGTVVTIPVSVTSWVGGAVFGIAAQLQN